MRYARWCLGRPRRRNAPDVRRYRDDARAPGNDGYRARRCRRGAEGGHRICDNRWACIPALRSRAEDGIESVVLHVPTIKPLDTEDVLNVARRAGRVITVEEHQVAGGFGSAIAECLVEHHPAPMRLIGIQDQFGQSGSPEELLTHYGLDSTSIENVA